MKKVSHTKIIELKPVFDKNAFKDIENIIELIEKFDDETSCIKYLEAIR